MSTLSSTQATAPAIPMRQVWLILTAVLIADALDLIDATITNVAAPTIAADLGGGENIIKWLGAGYALALGSLLVLGGRIGDRFGQRRTFLLGLGGFVAASAVAGLAFSPEMLIVARIVQGAFGALLIPQGMAIMTRTFPRDVLRKAFAAFGPMLGIFAVGGPVIAGLIIDADLFGLGWRPMFLVNIIVGGFGFVLAWRVLPRLDPDPTVRIDLTSTAVLGAAMFGLLYGLIRGSSDGWGGVTAILLVAAAILFAVFAVRQRTTEFPLLAPGLLANRGFTSGLLVGLLVFASFNGMTYVISLFFQSGLDYSPTRTSVMLLPLTVGIIIASGISMALIAKLGRMLVLIGLLITVSGAALMLIVVRTAGLDATWWQLSLVTMLLGMGAGACFSTIFDTALGDIRPDEAGAASGSLSAIQQIAAGIGSASITSVYFHTIAHGQIHAMTISLIVVLATTAVCLLVIPLLPRTAADIEH